MPSKALNKFQRKMLNDVDRMIEAHEYIQDGQPGNLGLTHLTRAGVLFLCVAWELYIEELALEAVDTITNLAESPKDLPLEVQKALSEHVVKYVKSGQGHLKPLELAGKGWKKVYKDMGKGWVGRLNSPNSKNIDKGFEYLLDLKGLSSKWNGKAKAINNFVSVRGDIAHRGSDAGNIHLSELRDNFRPIVRSCAVDTDNTVRSHIRGMFPDGPRLWNKTKPPYT